LAVQPSAPSACPACSSPVTEAANALLCPACFAHVPPYWLRRLAKADATRRSLNPVTKLSARTAALKELEYCLDCCATIIRRRRLENR
jgi:hypothetical protein